MKTYMFPGQGSQFVGMGNGLFERYGELVEQADDILGYSIKKLCLEDSENSLHKTAFTQPALFVVNALSYFEHMATTESPADFFVGHSLGEFNALMAAKCFDFATGLKLVKKRGELMGQAVNGAMAAILNMSKEEIEETLHANGLNHVYLANYNTPSQIVISGDRNEIAQAEPLFQGGKVRYYPLATSGAFHTPFMQEAQGHFTDYLNTFTLNAPETPVIANITARPYQEAKLVETLSSQISSMVLWSDSIQYLLTQDAEMEMVEVGPGDVLTKLALTVKAQTPKVLLEQLTCENSAACTDASAAMQAGAQNSLTDVENKVMAWNKAHPVGAVFSSSLVSEEKLESRTKALVLFGHRAAVYMKGYNGYFDLDELTPL